MFLFFLVVLFINPNLVYSSAWGKKEGDFFSSYSYLYYEADHFFDSNNKKEKNFCKFRKNEHSIYVEYGLREDLTMSFKAPYAYLECNSKNHGFSDLEVGLIRPVGIIDSSIFSLYLNSVIPTGYSYRDDPRLGYSVFGLDFGILYGYGYRDGFMDFQLLYRSYFGYPSNQVRIYFSNNFRFYKEVYAYFSLNTHTSLGSSTKKNLGSNIFLETDYFMLESTLGLRYSFKNYSIGLSYLKTLFGKKTGVGSGINIHLWKSF